MISEKIYLIFKVDCGVCFEEVEMLIFPAIHCREYEIKNLRFEMPKITLFCYY